MSETCNCGAEMASPFDWKNIGGLGYIQPAYTCGTSVGQEESCPVANVPEPPPGVVMSDKELNEMREFAEKARQQEEGGGGDGFDLTELSALKYFLIGAEANYGKEVLQPYKDALDSAANQIRSLQGQVEELEKELSETTQRGLFTTEQMIQKAQSQQIRAEQAESERDALKKAQEACRATANDFLDGRPLPPSWQDGTDAACPGWWRGHDHGAAGMEKKLKSERDEALAATAGMANQITCALIDLDHDDNEKATQNLKYALDRLLPATAQALLDQANEAERLKAENERLRRAAIRAANDSLTPGEPK